MTTIDTRNKELQVLITINFNEILKKCQSILLKRVSKMIATQLEMINNNMINIIQVAMINIQRHK